MVTPDTSVPAVPVSSDSIVAVVTLSFSRLWDLLSPPQRQFALHLAEPDRFESVTESLSVHVGFAWAQLPEHLRVEVLHAFADLPDVYYIGHR